VVEWEHERRQQWEPWPSWIFIYNADKVEGGLLVLFFGLVFFSLASNHGSIYVDDLEWERRFSTSNAL